MGVTGTGQETPDLPYCETDTTLQKENGFSLLDGCHQIDDVSAVRPRCAVDHTATPNPQGTFSASMQHRVLVATTITAGS
jgi:hypothetical protein